MPATIPKSRQPGTPTHRKRATMTRPSTPPACVAAPRGAGPGPCAKAAHPGRRPARGMCAGQGGAGPTRRRQAPATERPPGGPSPLLLCVFLLERVHTEVRRRNAPGEEGARGRAARGAPGKTTAPAGRTLGKQKTPEGRKLAAGGPRQTTHGAAAEREDSRPRPRPKQTQKPRGGAAGSASPRRPGCLGRRRFPARRQRRALRRPH